MHKVNLTTPDKVILVEVYQVDVPPPFSIKLPRNGPLHLTPICLLTLEFRRFVE